VLKKSKWIALAGIIVALVFVTPLFGIAAGSCMGYHDFVMERLSNCQPARDLLGDGIGVAYVGVSCGSAKTEGAYGRANWRMPVKGSKDSGTYEFYLEKHGGGWEMRSARLTVGDQEIDITSCAGGASSDGPVLTECSGARQCAQMGMACFQRGDMECAETGMRGACKGGNKSACGNLAHILLYVKDDAEGAATAARQACDADDASGCNNLAVALQRLNDSDGAYKAAKRSCSLGLDVGCAQLAYHEIERGKLKAAKRSANRALKKNAKRASALRRMGHAYLFEGDLDSALSYYSKALKFSRVSDKGQKVHEGNETPEFDLIRDEIKALVKNFPDANDSAQKAIERVRAAANKIE